MEETRRSWPFPGGSLSADPRFPVSAVLCARPQPGWPRVREPRRGAQSSPQRPRGSEVAAISRRARLPGRAALAATAGPGPLPLASPPPPPPPLPLRLLTLQRRLLCLSRARRGGGGTAGREGGRGAEPRACLRRATPAARLPRRHARGRWGETAVRARPAGLWAAGDRELGWSTPRLGEGSACVC